MDGALRLLTTELINLREECKFETKDQIVLQLQLYKHRGKTVPKKVSSDHENLTFLQRVKKIVRHVLGLNIISFWPFLFIATACFWCCLGYTYMKEPDDIMDNLRLNTKNQCLIENQILFIEAARPTFDCRRCENLTTFPIEENISKMQFLNKYAFTAVPVLVRNAVNDWQAFHNFSYDWFQKIYDNFTDSFDAQEWNGQFFPYKTKFENLEQALHMSEDRRKQPWYFGWSNAHAEVGAILRSQYRRPKFLPDGGDSSIDWIFMGTRGKGANVHLDNVARPSWQAQIKGIKTWYLVPTPECQSRCHEINATMKPGDIIVVDTNSWYHGTEIAPGDISITIGSEYD